MLKMNKLMECFWEDAEPRFGPETMVIGQCMERLTCLNGVRVENKEFGEGTIYNVLINRPEHLAQIWVNMDSGGARCLRPRHLAVAGFPSRPLAVRYWQGIKKQVREFRYRLERVLRG